MQNLTDLQYQLTHKCIFFPASQVDVPCSKRREEKEGLGQVDTRGQEGKTVGEAIAEAVITKVCNDLNIPLEEMRGRESDSNSGKVCAR